ncbi:hypothetical protein [Streptomyces sp. NPDC059788]|uniref:hypothetical protein n=1 Tax=Streptomyces sp. NPDC059788 TaxID=3346948 RepID=UPI003647E6DA
MILLIGRWSRDGNLIIESSRQVPDDADRRELHVEVYQELPDRQNGWAASFLVDTHRAACQEAYETYVREAGDSSPILIDNVEDVTVDT